MKSKFLIGVAITLSLFLHPLNTIADLEPPATPIAPLSHKEYAEKLVNDKWGSLEWKSFELLIQKESRWIHTAQNPRSTAYGLGQFLNSTWKTVGCEKTSDPYIQLDCAGKYVEARYGTPTKALTFHVKNNWY